jgi:hypothetical protein
MCKILQSRDYYILLFGGGRLNVSHEYLLIFFQLCTFVIKVVCLFFEKFFDLIAFLLHLSEPPCCFFLIFIYILIVTHKYVCFLLYPLLLINDMQFMLQLQSPLNVLL